MLRKAREGKVILPPIPDFGFGANEARDGYVVDEEKMALVRRIFRMVGEEARSINGVVKALAAEGILTPTGKRRWSRTMIRNIVKDDAYIPHTYSEMVALLSPEVATRLDPEKCYGVWWFNRRRVAKKQVVRRAETGGGRTYRKVTKLVPRPIEDWIAVPVPDAGVPREVVEAARETIKDNVRPSAAGERTWEFIGRHPALRRLRLLYEDTLRLEQEGRHAPLLLHLRKVQLRQGRLPPQEESPGC